MLKLNELKGINLPEFGYQWKQLVNYSAVSLNMRSPDRNYDPVIDNRVVCINLNSQFVKVYYLMLYREPRSEEARVAE